MKTANLKVHALRRGIHVSRISQVRGNPANTETPIFRQADCRVERALSIHYSIQNRPFDFCASPVSGLGRNRPEKQGHPGIEIPRPAAPEKGRRHKGTRRANFATVFLMGGIPCPWPEPVELDNREPAFSVLCFIRLHDSRVRRAWKLPWVGS